MLICTPHNTHYGIFYAIYSLKIFLITMDKKVQKDPRTRVRKEKAQLGLQ